MESKLNNTFEARAINPIRTSSLEKWVAKIYIFFLPIRLFSQLDFLKTIFNVMANYMAVVFHILGVLLWLLNEGFEIRLHDRKNSVLLKKTAWLVVYLNISSIFMACVIQLTHGSYAGENAFSGIAGILIYLFQFLLMFLYNIRVFTILNKHEIKKILHVLCVALLALGYVQVAVMNGIGGDIYDSLDIFHILYDSDMPKLCLTVSEGASAGSLIGVLVAPFLLSEIMDENYKWPIIELVLWLVPLFFTYSSTAYILFAVNIISFLLLSLRYKKGKGSWIYWGLIICIVLIVFVILIGTGLLSSGAAKNIRYLLFEKATDGENGSTVSRTIPFIINWGAFTEFPIFGVGNGLQGYFYIKYFPDWAFHIAGSDILEFYERSKYGIANGGVFIPSLLSGYGIVGCIAIIVFAVRCVALNKERKEQNGSFYYMYVLGAIAFLVVGFQGNLYGVYYAWFILSLPFVPSASKKREGVEL